MSHLLKTGISNVRNISRYTFAFGAIKELPNFLQERRKIGNGRVVFFVDAFFENDLESHLKYQIPDSDQVFFVSTEDEPTTDRIDKFAAEARQINEGDPSAIVGMGGGITLDTAKAVSNLLTNPGNAADYQGWDLVKNPGIFKIGIPTLSGTGAEATRTCVMTNKVTGLKLGMNSDHTVFDQLILDPDLTATVDRNQYFFSGMDAWIHCMESLNGSFRNPIGDAFSMQAINLCREVFCILPWRMCYRHELRGCRTPFLRWPKRGPWFTSLCGELHRDDGHGIFLSGRLPRIFEFRSREQD
jgi:3-deoxy-alpha-D-manno-octulosonate 8-oxidase